jgi:hypothetical protein
VFQLLLEHVNVVVVQRLLLHLPLQLQAAMLQPQQYSLIVLDDPLQSVYFCEKHGHLSVSP